MTSSAVRTSGRVAGLRRGLRRRWPLLALCAGLAVAEAVALQVVGFRSALPLAPQISAPASLGTYHDLRWLFTYNWSWWSLAWQLAALLAFRTVVTVEIIRLAWPAGQTPDGRARLLRRNLVATAVAVVALSPWAAITFAAQAVAYSWLMLLAIVGAFVTILVIPVAVTGRWWRRLILWRSACWVAVACLAATVEALAISFSPSWVAVLTAFGAGLLNAAIWLGLVRTLVRACEPTHAKPLAPVAIVAVLALFLVGGGFLLNRGESDDEPPGGGKPTDQSGQAVLYVSGFASGYDGGDFVVFDSAELRSWHYSYRGLGSDGPLSYAPKWTRQAVSVSAEKLATQIDWLAQRTGGPVALIAESEGALVTRQYFLTHPDPPVTQYILTSPLPRAGRVYYPPAGETGWGFAAGREVSAMLRLLQLENQHFTLAANMPLARSVVNNAGDFRPSMLCPVGPDIPTHAFIPLSGAMVVYHGAVSHVPWTALPGWHAGLLHRQDIAAQIERLLTTGRFTEHDSWTAAFRVLWGAAAAWQAPALPLDLRSGWHAPPHTDPAFAEWHCPG